MIYFFARYPLSPPIGKFYHKMDDFSTNDGYPSNHPTNPVDIIGFIACGTFGVILGLIAATFIISIPSLVINIIMNQSPAEIHPNTDFWLNYMTGTMVSLLLIIIIVSCITFPQI